MNAEQQEEKEQILRFLNTIIPNLAWDRYPLLSYQMTLSFTKAEIK